MSSVLLGRVRPLSFVLRTSTPPRAIIAALLFFSLVVHSLAQAPLPWEKPASPAPLLRPPSGPLEIFERFDIGASQLENFFSGQPLTPSEEDVLIKILYRFPRLGLDNLQRWRQQKFAFDQLAAAPADHRGQIFHLKGRAQRVERKALLAEQKELFEFDHYYLVSLALDDSPYLAQIATRKIPQAWPINVQFDEPTAADALYLKLGDESHDPPVLIFAAGSLGWYPDHSRESDHIGPAHLALAKLGLDLSLWDDIRTSSDHALTANDREAFYQLLHVLGHSDSANLKPEASSLNLVALLEKPQTHFADIMPVEGVARRVMRIAVNDADIKSRFGIDHYYEIDLFLSLGDASLRFHDPQKDKAKTGPTYRNSFPATLIARELPAGLAEGENVHQRIRADGVFFKTWAYRSSYTGQFNQLQPAPLFITRRPQIVATTSNANWLTGTLVTAAFTLGLAVILILTFVYSRSDRASRTPSRQSPAAQPDFNHLK